MTELFEHPTIKGLARRLAGSDGEEQALNAAQERARRQKEAMARSKRPRGQDNA
jgi:hypothetical protein